MQEPDWAAALGAACRQATAYLAGLPDRPVGPRAGTAELRKALGGPLPESPDDAREVVAALTAAADAGVVASAGGRYFGFVVGGAVRISVSNWSTDESDVDAAVDAILRCAELAG